MALIKSEYATLLPQSTGHKSSMKKTYRNITRLDRLMYNAIVYGSGSGDEYLFEGF